MRNMQEEYLIFKSSGNGFHLLALLEDNLNPISCTYLFF
jgi:hypothetical protein